MLHQIVKETGWTWHYILWKVSRANILMMFADRSHISYVKKEDQIKEDTGANLFKRFKKK